MRQFVFLLFSFFILTAFVQQSERLQKVRADVETRYWQQGISTTVKARMFYHTDGRMITHFTRPSEQIMRTNHLGELIIYDPETGDVTRQQSPAFSSETNHFFHFFRNQTEHMGLETAGYEQGDTEFEENIRKTKWYAPNWLANQVDYAELVHQEFRPIYMAIFDRDGMAIQKTYFHNYTEVLDYEFPQSITVISFNSPADSSVTQTRFQNIATNKDADDPMFDFQIPDPDDE